VRFQTIPGLQRPKNVEKSLLGVQNVAFQHVKRGNTLEFIVIAYNSHIIINNLCQKGARDFCIPVTLIRGSEPPSRG